MSLLEAIFAVELLGLFSAWILWIAGKMVMRNSPNDTIHHFAVVFWRSFARKPLPLRQVTRSEDFDEREGPEGTDEELLDTIAGQQPASADSMEDTKTARSDAVADSSTSTVSSAIRMVTLNVKVVPHASRDQIAGFLGKALKIQVRAAAEGGLANQAVIELLADKLGIKKHQIQLLRGHYQPQKLLQISGLSQQDLDSRLSAFE